jgi:hypothetical protein
MRARALAVVLALGALPTLITATALTAPVAAATAPSAAPAGTAPRAATASAAGAPGAKESTAPTGKVVLIGVPALQWSDVNPSDTPNLWRLTGRGAAGSLSVRTIGSWTCATDGWLSVSSAHKAKAFPIGCNLPTPPVPEGGIGTGGAATVADFARWRQGNLADTFQARIGLLGDAIHAAGGSTAAVGAGGAVAAADRRGRVDAYAGTLESMPPRVWASATFTAVDIDVIVRTYADRGVLNEQRERPVTEQLRRGAVRQADTAIGKAAAAAPAGATVLIAGISDAGNRPHLRVALAVGGRYGPGFLTSSATRREGMVHLSDVGTTVLAAAGVGLPDGAVGKIMTGPPPAGPPSGGVPPNTPSDSFGGTDDPTQSVVTRLAGTDAAAQTIRLIKGPFFIANVVIQLLLYLAAAIVLRRRQGTRRRRVLMLTRIVAIAGAALPAAAFLANLLPWWRAANPVPVLLTAYVVMDALVVAAALAGPWRRGVAGVVVPGTIVAAITALLLAADVVTGSRLQLNSPTGYDALAGGRFHGFGNIAFAVFATSMLLAAAGLAHLLLSRDRRLAAVLAIAGLGAVAIVLDGHPNWGSDFGGVVSLLPGVAVAALIVSGRRVSFGKVALFGACGIAVVAAMTYLDYSRPPQERTHLGQFAAQLFSGEGIPPVIARKLQGMLNTVGSPTLLPVILAALAFLVFVLLRPGRYQTGGLQIAYEHFPALRAGLIGALITALVGFGINDSGAAIPALSLTIAIPLALAASAQALRLPAPDPRTNPPTASGTSESAQASVLPINSRPPR